MTILRHKTLVLLFVYLFFSFLIFVPESEGHLTFEKPLEFEPYLCETTEKDSCTQDPINLIFVQTTGIDNTLNHFDHHLKDWSNTSDCIFPATDFYFFDHSAATISLHHRFKDSPLCIRSHIRFGQTASLIEDPTYGYYTLAASHEDDISLCITHFGHNYDDVRNEIANAFQTVPGPDGHVHLVGWKDIGNTNRIAQPCWPDPHSDGKVAVISIDNAPCVNNATFIADVTYPDGSALSPGQSFNKTWRLQNSGTCTWDTGYELAFLSGNQMGAPSAVSLPQNVAQGEEVDISVNMTAPTAGGTYRGDWRLREAQGVHFGDHVWVIISVPGGPISPPPPPGQSGGIDVLDVQYPSVVTPGQKFRPKVTVKVNSGQLLESRGDMLRNTDGNLYGAWPHVAVVGTVNPGQTYTFEFYEDNPITAPTATPIPTDKPLSKEVQPTSVKQYGGWYWRPELNKAQVWLGIGSTGNDIWDDSFPTPTQTPQRTADINSSDSQTETKATTKNTLGTLSTGTRSTINL